MSPTTIHPELLQLVRELKNYLRQTAGEFDPDINNLVDRAESALLEE